MNTLMKPACPLKPSSYLSIVSSELDVIYFEKLGINCWNTSRIGAILFKLFTLL